MRGSIAEVTSSLKGDSVIHYAFLTILDLIISSIIVAPLVVTYWRSVWELMGIYVFPNDHLISIAVSAFIGIFGHLFFSLTQNLFQHHFHPDRNRIIYYIISRLYTVCFAFVCVNGWRWAWSLLDLYTKRELSTVITILFIGIIALAFMRALRNVSSPPCAIATDYVKGYFEVLTMFRVTMVQKTSLYILDCLFSVLIVGTLVVFVWRGVWVLLDVYIFPEDFVWSSWASLIIGYTAVIIAFLLQPVMRWLCDRLHGASRLIVTDIFLCFSLIGTVNVWRGIWNLLNIYFLPDNLELSCWITHCVSLILLILLGCSNSLLVRGVFIDAEEPAGKCVVFPCYYLRLIFQREREKKEARKLQLENMTKHFQEIDIRRLDNNHITSYNITQTNNHPV